VGEPEQPALSVEDARAAVLRLMRSSHVDCADCADCEEQLDRFGAAVRDKDRQGAALAWKEYLDSISHVITTGERFAFEAGRAEALRERDAQVEALVKAAEAIGPYGVKWTSNGGDGTKHYSMCFIGDGDPLGPDSWIRLSGALIRLRAAAALSQEG
jgi:hypothetical protein